MRQMGNSATRMVVLALTLTALISGGITAFLVLNQMVPDIRAGVPGGTGNWQPYRESWDASLGTDGRVDVDLLSVDVEVKPWSGNYIKASFEGSVAPYSDGSLPKIVAGIGTESVSLAMDKKAGLSVGISASGGKIRGVLTVELPEHIPYRLRVDSFSGNVGVREYAARELTLTTSSGAIEAYNVASAGPARLESFSGDMTIRGLTASGECALDSSSGRIEAEDLTAGSLKCSQFSGNVKGLRWSIAGELELDGSSGRVELDGFSARTARINTFSGAVTARSGSVTGVLLTDGSSGKVELAGVEAGSVDVTTFSGDVILEGLNAAKLTAETSSGAVTGRLSAPADLDCKTFSGKIELDLPKETGFTLSADTFSGGISIGFPLVVQGDNSKSLRGQTGDGAHTVKLETSSGNITLNGR